MLLIALVELELTLGFWLLAGAYPKQARRMALAAFAGFCLVSLSQALTGAPSCGCFGKISVKPWHTLLFDLAAEVMLWRWKSGVHKHILILLLLADVIKGVVFEDGVKQEGAA